MIRSSASPGKREQRSLHDSLWTLMSRQAWMQSIQPRIAVPSRLLNRSDALNLPIMPYDAANTETIMDEIVKTHKGKIILVVGHSNTIPELIANMGASKVVPPIAEDEYDNIYIVTIPWFGKTKTIRLRYGAPYIPAT